MLVRRVELDFLLGYAQFAWIPLFDTSFIIQNTSIHYKRFAGPEPLTSTLYLVSVFDDKSTSFHWCFPLLISECTDGFFILTLCARNFSVLHTQKYIRLCFCFRIKCNFFFACPKPHICYCLSDSTRATSYSDGWWWSKKKGEKVKRNHLSIRFLFFPFEQWKLPIAIFAWPKVGETLVGGRWCCCCDGSEKKWPQLN